MCMYTYMCVHIYNVCVHVYVCICTCLYVRVVPAVSNKQYYNSMLSTLPKVVDEQPCTFISVDILRSN